MLPFCHILKYICNILSMTILRIIEETIKSVNSVVFDKLTIIILLGCGIYFSVKTRFIQIRGFKKGVNITFKNKSSFTSLATAVASSVGAGNIVGAAGAILIGGPGAVFWMWITAFIGMATVYREAVLSQITRTVNYKGENLGGPYFYIKKAIKGNAGKIVAVIFSASALLNLGFVGGMLQANAVACAFYEAFNINRVVAGVLLGVLAGVVYLGGSNRILKVIESTVVFMACFFIFGCIVYFILNFDLILRSISLIFESALNGSAVIGGISGYSLKEAVNQGVKKGLFSNEAGMGSTPHAHACAKVNSPHEQGCSAMLGVFIDSFVILSLTSLVMISFLYFKDGYLIGHQTFAESSLMMLAFKKQFGDAVGGVIVAVSLFFFAFSSIISWNYFGKINFSVLFKNRGEKVWIFLSVAVVIIGAVCRPEFLWVCTDLLNGLMVTTNVMGLVLHKNASF